MKNYLKDRFRIFFLFLTKTFGRSHREGFRILARLSFQQRALIVPFIVLSAASIFFEVGSLALIAIAVTILLGEGPIDISGLGIPNASINELANNLLLSLDRADIFLLLVLIAIVSQLTRSILTYTVTVISIKLQRRTSQKLQSSITDRLVTMEYEEVIAYAVGSLNEIIRLGDAATKFIPVGCMSTLAAAMFLGYIVLMIRVSIPMTLVAMCIVVLLSVGLTRVVTLSEKLGNQFTESMVKVGRLTVDYLNAPRLLRLFGSEQDAKEVINTERENYLELKLKAAIVYATLTPAFEVSTIVGAGLFLVLGYYFSPGSAQDVMPKIMIFLLVLNRMMPQVQILNKSRLFVANHLKSVELIGDLFTGVPATRKERRGIIFTNLVNEIQFRNTSFRYQSTKEDVLSNLEFAIIKGQTLAIVGPSGSGKSTLVDLLVGLLQPTSGDILVDGVSLSEIHGPSWRRRMGVVDQEAMLLNSSIRDNILFGRKGYSDQEVKRAAQVAHASEFIKKLKDDYMTIVGDRGQFLSGGQRQRLAIARALLSDPDLLILDEATSALDSESEQLIGQTLQTIGATKTIILIAHRISTLDKADTVLVLDQGKVKEYGARKDLMTVGTQFYAMWQRQRLEKQS